MSRLQQVKGGTFLRHSVISYQSLLYNSMPCYPAMINA